VKIGRPFAETRKNDEAGFWVAVAAAEVEKHGFQVPLLAQFLAIALLSQFLALPAQRVAKAIQRSLPGVPRAGAKQRVEPTVDGQDLRSVSRDGPFVRETWGTAKEKDRSC
jgi:hypothetical protein